LGGYAISVCNKPTRSTEPCIPPRSSSTSFGWGKGENVTSVGWQVTLCDPGADLGIWRGSLFHVIIMCVTSVIWMSFCAPPRAKSSQFHSPVSPDPLNARSIRSLGFPKSPPLKNPRYANVILYGPCRITLAYLGFFRGGGLWHVSYRSGVAGLLHPYRVADVSA